MSFLIPTARGGAQALPAALCRVLAASWPSTGPPVSQGARGTAIHSDPGQEQGKSFFLSQFKGGKSKCVWILAISTPHVASSLKSSSLKQHFLDGQTSKSLNGKRREREREKGRPEEGRRGGERKRKGRERGRGEEEEGRGRGEGEEEEGDRKRKGTGRGGGEKEEGTGRGRGEEEGGRTCPCFLSD